MKINQENSIIEDDKGNIIDFSYTDNSIYDHYIWFMVSCWGKYSYFSDEQIQISDIENMYAVISSSGLFG